MSFVLVAVNQKKEDTVLSRLSEPRLLAFDCPSNGSENL